MQQVYMHKNTRSMQFICYGEKILNLSGHKEHNSTLQRGVHNFRETGSVDPSLLYTPGLIGFS
jgi:hypothetical protein